MTVREFLKSVFRVCQVIGQGENLDHTSEEYEAFEALKGLIGSWSANRILLYNTYSHNDLLVKGTFEYDIGDGQTFDMDRPQIISLAYVSRDDTDYNLRIIDSQTYYDISIKNREGIPEYLLYDNSFPYGKIILYPVPDYSYGITMESYLPLIELKELTDEIILPAEYLRALKYNLAVDLSTEYATELSSSVKATAMSSLASVKKNCMKPFGVSKVDTALLQYRHSQDYFMSGGNS